MLELNAKLGGEWLVALLDISRVMVGYIQEVDTAHGPVNREHGAS